MGDFILEGKFDGIDEIVKKDGKKVNVLHFIFNHRTHQEWDDNNTLTTILLDNKVQVGDKVKFVGNVYVKNDGKFGVKVKNVQV